MTTETTEDTRQAETPQAPMTRADQLRAVATLVKSGGLRPLAIYVYGERKKAAKNSMYQYVGKGSWREQPPCTAPWYLWRPHPARGRCATG
ncbi:hypothetical protein KHQ06_21935 [Nocardia tengchongensis]|uniref:Transposase n=1 Tax=Nocardia tengchongensis TaxID=2055889 RepID=A0ABX8CJN5_9NOCA|nr:hypothetical protein [Nocardia tengchongensis]QVI19119.1 hypothetical protein KHQ06_21935 [Nocardia tengchongensis]